MSSITVYSQLTLLELAKRTHNANTLAVAETLNATNEIFNEAIWFEANGFTGHVVGRRTALPSGTFRDFNDGVVPEASTVRQITEPIGSLEAYSTVDKALVDVAPNPTQFRQMEDAAFIEGLSQTFATAFVYGSAITDPEKFHGLAPRVTSSSATNAISGGGSSSCSSIWVIQWHPQGAYMVYPRGSNVGITVEDLGVQTVSGVTSSSLFQAYRTHFVLKAGLVVADNRCIQRLANLTTTSSTVAGWFNEDKLLTLLNRLPYGGRGAVIYANQAVKTAMDIKAKDKTNVVYSVSNAFGEPVTMFRNVPVRRIDAITNTETAI